MSFISRSEHGYTIWVGTKNEGTMLCLFSLSDGKMKSIGQEPLIPRWKSQRAAQDFLEKALRRFQGFISPDTIRVRTAYECMMVTPHLSDQMLRRNIPSTMLRYFAWVDSELNIIKQHEEVSTKA